MFYDAYRGIKELEDTMNLIRYNPRGLNPRFPFDRWFDDFFSAPEAEPDGTRTWSPAVDIEESDKEITLKADLPDVDEKDLSIKVEDDVLTLQAERKFEKESKMENFHRLERAYGSFHRRFALPDSVDVDKIKAAYDKGVLKITLPKLPEKQPKVRQIRVH